MYEKSVTDPSSFFRARTKRIGWFEKPSVGYSGKITKPTWFRDGCLIFLITVSIATQQKT